MIDNDLISRQAAIEHLKTKISEIYFKETAEKNVEKWINELPTIQPNKTIQWMKCSDKMPEENTHVIVAVYGSDVLMVVDSSFESLKKAMEESRKNIRYTTMASYVSGDGWYSADGFPMTIAPTYWMPMPEPPKE